MKIHMPADALLLVVILMIGLGGCGGTPKPITTTSQRTDVFTETRDSSRPAEGEVDLTIKASVKTPTPEHYLLESKPQPPAGGFPFELNVDGQEIVWKVEGARENTPVHGPSGRLPEGGEGIRYVLEKTIRLPAGPDGRALSWTGSTWDHSALWPGSPGSSAALPSSTGPPSCWRQFRPLSCCGSGSTRRGSFWAEALSDWPVSWLGGTPDEGVHAQNKL